MDALLKFMHKPGVETLKYFKQSSIKSQMLNIKF